MSDKIEKQETTNEEIIERVKTTLKENPNSLYLMKKGDYSVHVLIEEIKNLASIQKDSLPKPIIKVTCFNETKRTSKPPQDCEAYTFNEHIYFDATNLSVDTLDSSKILIEAYDYHNSEREHYFGMQEFDFEYIYSKENHCIKNLWVALANPEAKDITKINGYLKLSISICSTEDDKVELNPDPTSDSDCMLPPQIKTTYKQLQIFIYKGEQFPDMDVMFGKERTTNKRCDGCVEVKYLGVTKSTQIVSMKNDIIQWNEMIEMPVPLPIISQKINFIVKDKSKNIIGSFTVNINDILSDKYTELTSVNIYGSLKAADSTKAGKLMNENPDFGSRWKGRVYLNILHKDSEFPTAGVQKITDTELINKVNNTSRKYLWSLNYKLYSAYYLPTENGSYDIKISVQEMSDTFVPKEAYNRSIDWNLCKSRPINTLTQNLEELPDLIIYLMQKGKEVCFQRIKLSQFHLNDDIFVIKLFPEPCVNLVKEVYLSGIIKIKIKLFNRAIDPPEKCDTSAFKDGDESGAANAAMGINNILSGGGGQMNNFNDDEDLENMLNEDKNNEIQYQQPQDLLNQNQGDFKFYTVVACVYMTRYLIAGDSTGLSDPYCRISINGETRETTIRYKCVNGIWNEKLVFDTVSFNYKDQSTWPVMLLTVMDKDLTSSDMLGYSYIWLSDTNYKYNSPEKIRPKWEQLYLQKSNRAQGQILISFYIFDQEHRDQMNRIEIEPETVPFSVEINALGLRDLKPLSFIKIKKPYVSFDLNSINVSTKHGQNLQPVTTLPNDVGANPNINSVIKFMVNLPKNEIFIPEFQCDVYDHVLGGLSKRVLGIFLIDLKQIISETQRHYKEEYEEAERVKVLLEEKENKKKNNNIINTNTNNVGMLEKDDDNLINSKENLNGNDKSEALLDTAEPGFYTMDKSNKNFKPSLSSSYLCHFPSDLNNVYKGQIDNELLNKEKDNSEYFALKPSFTIYNLPQKSKKSGKNVNNANKNEIKIENGMRELDNKSNVGFIDDFGEENLVENPQCVPNSDLYFPIGFNKNENPLKGKEKGDIKKMLGEIELSDDEDEKQGLIKKTGKKITNNKKHYRRIYRKELENVKELALGAPFIKCHLLRNKYEDTLSSITNLLEGVKDENNKIIKKFKPKKPEKKGGKLRAVNNLRMNYRETDEELMRNKELTFDLKNYGYFKGLIRIAEKSKYDEHKQYIQNIIDKYKGELPPELTFLTAFDDLGKNVLVKRSVIVRVYILELNNLARRDTFSESDPYIKILLGDKLLVNEKKKAFKDTKNCKWYQYYDLRVELPGSSKLRIQVMDYDALFSDDLVGETSIDIEDRYFDNRWQALENKPIEVRQLYHPDFEKSQGEVVMWLEMYDQDEENKMEPWNIEPEPVNKLQMRLIIYETEGMENLDIEDTSDIYVMAFVDAKNKAQTDVHYRCSTGQGSFNWRMLIPVEIPGDKYDLTIQVFDSDILSKDDYICGGRLNLYQLFNDVNILDLPLKLNSEYYSSLPNDKRFSNIEFVGKDEDEEGAKFWVQLEKQGKKGGRVLCSIEVVPQWYAELNPVGKGRDEPNMNPYLPPPVGRIKFTLNPFKMLNQLSGPKFRKKCYWIVCMICLIAYLIFMVPYIVYFISGEIFNPFNYVGKGSKDDDKKNN